MKRMVDIVMGAMRAVAENGYARFEENGLDVVMPTVPDSPEEVDVGILIDTHRLISGDYKPGTVEVDNDGSWRWLR